MTTFLDVKVFNYCSFFKFSEIRSKFLLANTVMLALNGFVSFFVPRLELSYNRVKV